MPLMRSMAAGRAIVLSTLLAFALVGCGPPAAPAACAPIERLAAPVQGDDLVDLQAIMDRALDEVSDEQWSRWNVTLIDADESRGTVVFGSSLPTEEMCITLRARYGPLVEGIYSPPGELYGGRPIDPSG